MRRNQRKAAFLTPEFLKRQQALLEAKLKEYQGLAQVAQRGISASVEDVGDVLDCAAAEGERSRNVQELRCYQGIIRQIKSALSLVRAPQRGEGGGDEEYGKCPDCNGQIPQKRLEAIPWALLCAPCQSNRESITVSG